MTRNTRPRTRHDYLSRRAAADECGVSTRTLDRWIADGTLPAYRLAGHVVRIRETDLDKLATRIPVAVTR